MSEEEKKEHVIPAPTISSASGKVLDTPYFSQGQWPDEKWWKLFDSSDLNGLIEIALKDSPTLRSAEERIQVAKQSAIRKRSKLYPLVSFDSDDRWRYLSANGLLRALNPNIDLDGYIVNLTIGFDYEFDFWGKNRNIYNSALGFEKMSFAESKQTELIITTSLAQAYFALKTNFLRKKLIQQLLTIRKNTYQLNRLLYEKALFSKLFPLLADERMLEVDEMLDAIENEITQNKNLIRYLIGKGPDFPVEIEGTIGEIPKKIEVPKTLSLDLLTRRPDLMASIWRVEALAHLVGAAKADFFPNINLKGLAGLESLSFNNLFDWSSKTAGLFPAIHLPIFTAGEIRANVREKKAQFDEAVYDYNDLLLKSAQEVANSLVFVETLFKQRGLQKKIVDRAYLRLSLADLRAKKGLDNLLDVYTKEEEWVQRKIEDVQLLYTQYLSIIGLMKSLGGGYSSEYSVPIQKEKTDG